MTGATTTVSALLVDPVGTPTAGTTAFVRTADGYAQAEGCRVRELTAEQVGSNVVT